MRQLCYRHHDRLAVRRCQHCQTPVCSECVVIGEGGANVCSFACAERVAVLAKERAESEKLDPWPTRIWTSLFLMFIASVVGGFGGFFLAFAQLTRRYGYRGEHFPEFLQMLVIGGALVGAGTACGFLIKYYRRKS